MRVEFDFRQERSGVFGLIARPVARVVLVGENNQEIPEIFYVDSGADVTLIPRSLGELLGFTMHDPAEIQEMKGIGEQGVPFLVRNVKMRFNENMEFSIRIAWSLIEGVPPLLGRVDIFNMFKITFEKEQKTIFIL